MAEVELPGADSAPGTIEPVAVLRSLSPPAREYLLYPGRTEIGARQPAKIILERPEISSRHACVECSPGADGQWNVSLADLKSTNGTFVNQKRVKSCTLRDGDKVAFAKPDYAFEFRLVSSLDEPRVTMHIK